MSSYREGFGVLQSLWRGEKVFRGNKGPGGRGGYFLREKKTGRKEILAWHRGGRGFPRRESRRGVL